MPLRMFGLPPGRTARYRVLPVGGEPRAVLSLFVTRPDEGVSSALELSLHDAEGGMVDVGRVPIDGGYIAVLKEIRRQFDSVSDWRACKEFDLVADETFGEQGAAGVD